MYSLSQDRLLEGVGLCLLYYKELKMPNTFSPVITTFNDLKSLRMTLGWVDCTSSIETGNVDVQYFNLYFQDESKAMVIRDGYMLFYEREFPSNSGIGVDNILEYDFNCGTVIDATQQFKILQTYCPENVQLWFDTLHNAIHKVVNN
tara:strand:+ start:4685 stop:5125 length:441 start_codon:yes stop_codon:yes gene_type:complete